jgi:hypothetical protein
MKPAYIALGLVWVLGVSAMGIQAACTPAQKADARTALNVSSCINAVVLRHLEDDLKNPSALAVLASEIAIECNPQQKATE